MRADVILDYNVLVYNRPQKLNLMARFSSGPATEDRNRRPLNLSLVIDRSGSMAGDKIDYTRQAAQFLVQNLSAQDILSVVLYNDTVETLLQPEVVRRKDVINQRISGIKARGTTNLSGGWLEGCNLVTQNIDPVFVNRVILMSDGLANRGVTDSDQIISMVRKKLGEGISTTTMGLGNDFNEDLMMDMASAGGGAFYFIESPEVTPLIFQEELQGLLNVVGQNLMVTIKPSPYVSIMNQLHAYPMHTDGQSMTFRLGDVFGEEVKALLLELSVDAIPTPGELELATLRYEYDELLNEGVRHHIAEFPVTIRVQADEDVPKLPHPDVEQSVLLLRAANARKRAVRSADRGEFDTASQVLRDAALMIQQSVATNEKLDEERQALLKQADEIALGQSTYNEYNRKTMSTQAFYTMTSRHDDTVMLRVREMQRQTGSPVLPGGQKESLKIEPREGVTPTHVNWNDKTFHLEGDLIRIGRSRHNEITISASGVSRFHCQVRREGDQYLLEDLGSTNGTVVGGVLLDAPHILNVGDVAYICDEKLVFHNDDRSGNAGDDS